MLPDYTKKFRVVIVMKCQVCFRQCDINEGELGFCGARTVKDGVVVADNYGKLTSVALDPIEKKPLNRFYPGSRILSVGSYGCSLRCPFCQNYEISWSDEAFSFKYRADYYSPKELAAIAKSYESQGNIGIAFTYNEPLVGYEYIRDTAKLVSEYGMKNVLVTGGNASLLVLNEIAPYIDAMNIDLKGFTDRYYSQVIKGNRKMVMDFIIEAYRSCHIEITTLIIPGENDSDDEIRELSSWIAGIDRNIPLHISRFFPAFHMTDRDATNVEHIYRLADIAREKLSYVYTGNC